MVGFITNVKLDIISHYRQDYTSEYHLRELAQKLKKAHTTIIRHLDGLEADKILLSTVKGRNKLYRLNLANLKARQYMSLAEQDVTMQYYDKVFLVMRINEELAKLTLPGCIVLFGSYAKGTFKEDSDIDILYIGRLSDEQEQNIKKIGKTYHKTINVKKVIDFSKALQSKDALSLEVVKHHIILQQHENFVNTLWRYYQWKS